MISCLWSFKNLQRGRQCLSSISPTRPSLHSLAWLVSCLFRKAWPFLSQSPVTIPAGMEQANVFTPEHRSCCSVLAWAVSVVCSWYLCHPDVKCCECSPCSWIAPVWELRTNMISLESQNLELWKWCIPQRKITLEEKEMKKPFSRKRYLCFGSQIPHM